MAHLPREARHLVGRLVTDHLSREAVGRAVGQHHAGQQVEVRQVRPAHRRSRLQVSEVEGPGHRAVGGDVRGAGMDVHVERVGAVLLHVHQRPAGDVGLKGRRVQAARALQAERPGAGRAGVLAGADRAAEAELALDVVDPDLALVQHEMLDQRQLRGLAAALAESPVVAAVLVGIERDRRMLDVDQRQLHVARQQRQELHLNGGPPEVGHVGLAAPQPVGVADPQPADRGPRLPGEGVHLQVALDLHLPPRAGREVAAQGSAEPVPAEHGEEHRHGDGEDRPDRRGADQPPAPAVIGEGVAHIRSRALAPAPQPGAESDVRMRFRTGGPRVGQRQALPNANFGGKSLPPGSFLVVMLRWASKP